MPAYADIASPATRAGLIVIFALLGLAGNYLHFPLLFGVDFLFGSIAALLAAQLLGVVPALVSAAAASAYTLFLWNHPYAVVIFVAEAAFVSALLRTRPGNVVLYDLLYWLVAGVPLVLLFYAMRMGMDTTAVSLIALKQAVNGVFNALVAGLCAQLIVARGWLSAPASAAPRRASESLSHVLLAFVLVPCLVLVFLYGRVRIDDIEQSVARSLTSHVQGLRDAGLMVEWAGREPRAVGAALGIRFGSRPVALVGAGGEILGESVPGWLGSRPVVRTVRPELTQRLQEAGEMNAMTRWRRSHYAVEVPVRIGQGGEQRLIVGASAEPYVDGLWEDYLAGLGITLAIAVLGLAGAEWVGRRIPAQLSRLAEVSRAIPRRIRDGEAIRWPSSHIREFADLVENFRQMQSSLEAYVSALSESERRFRTLADHLPGVVLQRVRAPDGQYSFSYVSPKARALYGVDAEHALEQPHALLELIVEEDRPAYYATLERSAAEFSPVELEVRIRRPDGEHRWLRIVGHPRPLEGGAVVWDSIVLDETERKQAQAQIHYLARYDPLTGIPNRGHLRERLQSSLAAAHQGGPQVAVLFLDLDNLKEVNDTRGHAFGDQVLKAVGRRLETATRSTDVVGRVGGDEFVVLAHDIRQRETAARIAQKLLEAVKRPIEVGDETLYLGASIGVSMIPKDADTPEEALRRSDLALYYAKRHARGTYRFFEPDMDATVQERRTLVDDLRVALERGEFLLHYQPQLDLLTGGVVGAEALVRWVHPERGMVAPDRFIRIAEETGLIHPLGAWILREACRQAVSWHAQGLRFGRIAVNLSGAQIVKGDILAVIEGALGESGLDGSRLELEITESVLVDARQETVQRLFRELARLGVSLAVDDFGTGYSSLLVLRDAPVSRIKVDKEFVQRAADQPEDAEIVRGVIALAHGLRQRVVAEGVETEGQLALLRELGCDEVQGYYFSRPVPADEYARFLRSRQPARRSARSSYAAGAGS